MRKVFIFLIGWIPAFAGMSVAIAVAAAPSVSALRTDYPALSAPQAILMDYDSGKVLYEKAADVPASPSSMSKMLTAYRIFELLKAGKFKLSDEFTMSKGAFAKARRMNANDGSTMFMEQGEKAKVGDLIRGLLVLSANDAAIVLAEGAAGSENEFVAQLNELALRLGLRDSTILNASGWGEAGHEMSVRDLATLSLRLIRDFPEYYHYFGEKEFMYKPEIPSNKDNRNKLLWIMPGADGLKTGHTTRGGYGVAASAKRGERRFIAVVNGLKGDNPSYGRFTEAKSLMDWGFRNFSAYVYYQAGKKVLDVPVWYGSTGTVIAGAATNISTISSSGAKPEAVLRAKYLAPVIAPVAKGQKLGELELYIDGKLDATYELVALQSVRRTWGLGRAFENIKQWIIWIWR